MTTPMTGPMTGPVTRPVDGPVPRPVDGPATTPGTRPARRSALYPGTVVHRRRGPVDHDLRQGVVLALFDLGELASLDREVAGFGVDRAAPVSFRSRDHGPAGRDTSPDDLRSWVREVVATADPGLDVSGAVRILCMPRVLGHAFDPISVWFLHDPHDRLTAVVHEVRNTFGQRHAYVVGDPLRGAVRTTGATILRHRADKAFHVSPFFDVSGTYDFTVRVPDDRAALGVTYRPGDGHDFVASFAGRRRDLTTGGLWREMLRHPLLPQAVLAGIHLHAGALWAKGATYHPVPPAGDPPVTPACPVAAHDRSDANAAEDRHHTELEVVS